MNLSSKEIATLLAALRYWQSFLTQSSPSQIADIKSSFDHFESEEMMTSHEIDALCEKFNLDTEDPSLTFGMIEAIKELHEDPELKVFEVEIGLFDYNEDPTTPYNSHMVVVAACDTEEANIKAMELCSQKVQTDNRTSFSPLDEANEIEPHLIL